MHNRCLGNQVTLAMDMQERKMAVWSEIVIHTFQFIGFIYFYCSGLGLGRRIYGYMTFDHVSLWSFQGRKVTNWQHNKDLQPHLSLPVQKDKLGSERAHTDTHRHICVIRHDISAEKHSTNRLQREFILVPCRSASDLGFRGNTRTAVGVLNPQPAKRHHQSSYCANLNHLFPFKPIW